MSASRSELANFNDVRRVVADPLRFKQKLRIGEDAYASLRVTKHIRELWDVGGVAATGGAMAASPIVASTFFASTASGGVLSWIGLGTAAATPFGWVIAAALASGGAYYGVMRVARQYSNSRVDVIPKFINTPLDLLAATLFDLIGGLAARVALIDGSIAPKECDAITKHFVEEWGLEPAYVGRALDVICAQADSARVEQLARAVADFQASNPDCNPAAMQADIMRFLREVVEADGVVDEREELALDAVDRLFREQRELSFAGVRRAGGKLANTAAVAVGAMLRRPRGDTG